MFPMTTALLLSLLVLSGPVDEALDLEAWGLPQELFALVCQALELYDPDTEGDPGDLESYSSGFVAEMQLRWRRARDLPPLLELAPFPPRDVLHTWLNWQTQCLNYWELRYRWDKAQENVISQLLDDLGQRRRLVAAAFYAQSGGDPVTRRENLAYLRQHLPPACYLTGRLPCPVPWCFFTRID
jgi:hypothetical protein